MKYHSWQSKEKQFTLVDITKAKQVAASYIRSGHNVLDIGCGDCSFFDLLRKKAHTCAFHAFDVEPDALKIATKKGYIAHKDLASIKETFDVVTMFEVLEHLTIEERIHYAVLLSKLVKKDGYLILSFPHVKSFLSVVNYFNNQDHKTPYPKVMGLKYLFDHFQQKEVKYFTPWVNPIKILQSLATGLSWNAVYNNVAIVLKKFK